MFSNVIVSPQLGRQLQEDWDTWHISNGTMSNTISREITHDDEDIATSITTNTSNVSWPERKILFAFPEQEFRVFIAKYPQWKKYLRNT